MFTIRSVVQEGVAMFEKKGACLVCLLAKRYVTASPWNKSTHTHTHTHT
jgi:hypothetical protein